MSFKLSSTAEESDIIINLYYYLCLIMLYMISYKLMTIRKNKQPVSIEIKVQILA